MVTTRFETPDGRGEAGLVDLPDVSNDVDWKTVGDRETRLKPGHGDGEYVTSPDAQSMTAASSPTSVHMASSA